MAILIVPFCIKLVLFPLANKSYVSMSKMKKLGPEMQRMKERYGEDRARQQQAMMELYKKEKVNPASGCLPILVQIPIFFALYKVLFVTIEMRHAPFFGWIRDLSAPDPTRVLNLFGLILDAARLPDDRHLAADHGRHHVGADEAQSGAARSGAAESVRLDAGVLHLPLGAFTGGPGDLLGVEQHALGYPAIGDHVAAGGGHPAARGCGFKAKKSAKGEAES